MNRAEKAAEVEVLKGQFEENEALIITHYSGLTVSEMTELRGKLRAEGAGFKVIKNTLARRAAQGTKFEQMAEMFSGPVGIAVSTDPVAAAKVTHEFSKKHDKLVVLGGALGEKKLESAEIETLAKLPSLDQLRGKLVGLLQAPAQKIATIMQTPASNMVGVLKAQGEKSE